VFQNLNFLTVFSEFEFFNGFLIFKFINDFLRFEFINGFLRFEFRMVFQNLIFPTCNFFDTFCALLLLNSTKFFVKLIKIIRTKIKSVKVDLLSVSNVTT